MEKRMKLLVIIIVLIVVAGAVSFGFYLNSDFEVDLIDVVTLSNQQVSPDDFVGLSEEMRNVSIEFSQEQSLSFNPGINIIEFELTRGLRSRTETAALYVIEPIDSITIEFALYGQYLEPIDFIENSELLSELNFTLNFVDEFPILEELPVGQMPIDVMFNGVIFTTIINVVDTTPPVAITRDIEVLKGEEVSPEDFLVEGSVYDASPIALIEFLHEFTRLAPNEYLVEIVIADVFDNTAVFEAFLSITPNDIPPTIEGAVSFEVLKDSPVRFREGVSATDAFGRELEVQVNTGLFDVGVMGLYDITYYVVDAWGLRTEVTVQVRVIGVCPDYVRERINNILDGILRDGMTQVEEARAIFNWIRSNMRVAPDIRRDSIYEAALHGLQARGGNCFTYFSLAEVMLTQAGIPNMMIERIPGQPTTHRWNLINPDNLGWHHFDAMPTRAPINRFMFTSGQIPAMNAALAELGAPTNYYTYLPELYPEIVR